MIQSEKKKDRILGLYSHQAKGTLLNWKLDDVQLKLMSATTWWEKPKNEMNAEDRQMREESETKH